MTQQVKPKYRLGDSFLTRDTNINVTYSVKVTAIFSSTDGFYYQLSNTYVEPESFLDDCIHLFLHEGKADE